VHGLLASGFTGKVYIADTLPESDSETFFRKVYKRRVSYYPLPIETTLIEQLNFLWQKTDADIVAYTHNDVYLYGNWQEQVTAAFEDERVGFVVALGCRGTLPGGGRLDIMSNMLEAEIHGRRSMTPAFVTHGDGLFMAFRRKALEDAGGFSTRYLRFHFYDRSICLSVLNAGYLGRYVPISCHHRSGVTACGNEYQNYVNRIRGVSEGGDAADHNTNMRLFDEEWAAKLPVMVDGVTGEFLEGGEWNLKKWR